MFYQTLKFGFKFKIEVLATTAMLSLLIKKIHYQGS